VNFVELAAFLCLGGGPGAIPSDASVRNRKKKWWAPQMGAWRPIFSAEVRRFPPKKGSLLKLFMANSYITVKVNTCKLTVGGMKPEPYGCPKMRGV